jgi:transcriptional regulator with XRE-family HTH domain
MDDKELFKSFAARLTTLREERGWDKEQAARRVECSPQYYGRLESGEKGCSLQFLSNLARAFAVDVTDLFCFPDTADRHGIADLLRVAPPDVRRRAIDAALKILAPQYTEAVEDAREPRSRIHHKRGG